MSLTLNATLEKQAADRNGKIPDVEPKPEAEPKPTFAGMDISELSEHADSNVDWLVKGIFSSDQPTLFGAKSKCLKTSQLVDLAVALGSGTDWLGTFTIPKPRRVLFITGESNYRAISRRLLKAAMSRGYGLDDLKGMVRIEAINFPKLPNIEHCVAVEATVKKYNIDVVIVDPLYRGIPADMDTNRMAQVGDSIVMFAKWCQPASLIISHHVTKMAARTLGSPPDLEDLTGAGIAESCGNWWLVGRNERYAWDSKHDLCVSFGGRDEQAGGRRILFNESTWTAEVSNLHEFIDKQQVRAERAKYDAKRAKDEREVENARASINRCMTNIKVARSKADIEAGSGIGQKLFRRAFADLVSDETVVAQAYQDSMNRTQSGWILATFKEAE